MKDWINFKNPSFVSWSCFSLFLAVNFFISYNPFSLLVKITLGLIGLGPVFFLLLRRPSSAKKISGPASKEISFPPLFWVVVFSLSVLLRFWKLNNLFVLPGSDEALYGLRALQLSDHWEWNFFYYGQVPPLLIWASAGLMKILHNPLLSLWIPAAIVSILTVFAAVFAGRAWGSKTYGWILGTLFAFSYWPLQLGRICQTGALLPPWELLGAYFLARYAKAPRASKKYWAAFLGAWAGLGYFTFPSFPVVTLVFTALFIYLAWVREKRAKDSIWYLVCCLIALSPLVWEWWKGDVGGHIDTVAFWANGQGWDGFLRLLEDYLCTLFWGGPAYGLFNPLLVSLSLIGWAVLGRVGKNRHVWLGLLLVLFLVPGFLSMNVETYRGIQVLPVVLGLSAWGLQSLLSLSQKTWRISLLALFLLVLLGMDFRQLTLPYLDPGNNPQLYAGTGKTIERYRAYRLLKETYDHMGPGFIFTEFCPEDNFDFSLRLAVMPMNALDRGDDLQATQWAAVVTHLDYQPFLNARFPGAKWFVLDSDKPGGGQLGLAILPLTAQNRPIVERWIQGWVCFLDIERAFVDVQENQPSGKPMAEALEHYALAAQDRMLLSCYWERMAGFFYFYMGHPYDKTVYAFEQAVKGYPAAHLYFNLGSLYLRKGHLEEARKAFENAAKAPLNLCPTGEALKMVDEMEKKKN